jgi:hypothetical protein
MDTIRYDTDTIRYDTDTMRYDMDAIRYDTIPACWNLKAQIIRINYFYTSAEYRKHDLHGASVKSVALRAQSNTASFSP